MADSGSESAKQSQIFGNPIEYGVDLRGPHRFLKSRETKMQTKANLVSPPYVNPIRALERLYLYPYQTRPGIKTPGAGKCGKQSATKFKSTVNAPVRLYD